MYEFTNRKTGEKLKCEFYVVSAEDESSMRAFQTCIQEEYAGTYLRREINDIDYLSRQIRENNILCYLAVNDSGNVVSTLALTPLSCLDGVLEMGSHVVSKKYRGYGVGTVFSKALLDLPWAKRCASVTAHSVTCHVLAQHQTISCGLIPTGFLFSDYSNAVLKPAYDCTDGLKQTVAVGMYPTGKKDAGVLYVPQCHSDFVKSIYQKLKASFSVEGGSTLAGETSYKVNSDDVHHVKSLQVFRAGDDLGEILNTELSAAHHPEQVVNIFLNINDPTAPAGFELAKSKGFVFAGLHPLCGNGEFFILHHPMGLGIPFDKLCIDEGYREVFDYIRNRA